MFNIKSFFATFIVIFFAELLDKTELAVISLSLKERSKSSVFWGAMFAFFIATFLAVVFGGFVSKFVSPKVIRYVSSIIFFLVGIFILLGKI